MLLPRKLGRVGARLLARVCFRQDGFSTDEHEAWLFVPPLLKLAIGPDILPFAIDLTANPSSIPLYLDSFSKTLAAGEPSATVVTNGG